MKVALLGTGFIGYPIAEKVIEAGHDVTVYNRTTAKAEPLRTSGARIAESVKGAVEDVECIILVLSDAIAIEEVLFSDQTIVLTDKTVIQMGTISPNESIEFQKKIFKRGGEYFECPVLGSKKEAKEASLILMVGSSKERFEKWSKFLKAFGPEPRLIGDVGKAAALKLAVNQLIAAHAVSFSLSLGIIEKNGTDINLFMEIVRQSSLYAPMFDKKLDNWIKRQYDHPNFPAKHLLKDVNLIVDEAREKGLSTGVIKATQEMFQKAVEEGLADKDYSSVFNVINKIKK